MNENSPDAIVGADRGASHAAERPCVPDHELLRQIGSGSYGDVWLARNVMGTYRAVKVVYRARFSSDRPYRREFSGIEKYEPISRSHDGLVDVLQVGRNDQKGYFYYVMELADDACASSAAPTAGETPKAVHLPAKASSRDFGSCEQTPAEIPKLANASALSPSSYVPRNLADELRRRGRLPVRECLEMALTLTRAVGHLHRHELTHRDIKPSNIIFVHGIPKLADIGLVTGLSDARSFVGTEGFLPPEGPGKIQADIYALGKVLYEMGTGNDRHDFPDLPPNIGDGNDPAELIEFNQVILKACETEPGDRYASAEAMYADLVLVQGGHSVRRLRNLEKRLRLTVRIATALLLISALSTGGIYLRHRFQSERELRSRLEMQRAESLLSEDEASMALAHLAKLARRDPYNRAAASRLVSLLSDRRFALPSGQPLRHRAQVHMGSFAPDGRHVLTASADSTARMWDPDTDVPLRSLQHEKAVLFAQLSRDGAHAVTASADNTARIWRIHDDTEPPLELLHQGPVMSANFSPDGRQIVTASYDGTARLWIVQTGKTLGPPLRHRGRVTYAEFSPDGRHVVTASEDGTAEIWNSLTGEALGNPLQHRGPVLSAQFSQDSALVVTASTDGTARCWEVHSSRAISNPLAHEGPVLYAEFSPDGNHVVTASTDRTARIWERRTGRTTAPPLRHEAPIYRACFSPDGFSVATASADGTARIWNSRTGRQTAEPIRHEQPVTYLQFQADGSRLLTASADGTARLWSLVQHEALGELLPTRGRALAIGLRSNGGIALTASQDESLSVATATENRLLGASAQYGGRLITAEFSSDRTRFVTASSEGGFKIWDAQTGALLAQSQDRKPIVQSARFTVDGGWILTAALDGTVQLWETASGRLLKQIIQYSALINSARLSPDRGRLVTASVDRTVRVWDINTGLLLTEFRHKDAVNDALFSPDGTKIVTASDDHTAQVWNAENGGAILEPLRHDGSVYQAVFSPDGDRIATASADGSARIWDLQSGQALTEPMRHGGRVRLVQFNDDGRQIITGTDDQLVRVWHVPTPPLPIPAWVPDLAEAVAGHRVNDKGVLEATVFRKTDFQVRATRGVNGDFWHQWSDWIFASDAARRIAPFSSVSTPEYIARRLSANTASSLREAAILSRTNGQAYARLAGLALDGETDASLAEALFYSHQAVRFAANDDESWAIRARSLSALGKTAEARAAISRALDLTDANQRQRRRYLLLRHALCHRLGLVADANGDFAVLVGPRHPEATPEMIDLSALYNSAVGEAVAAKANDPWNSGIALPSLTSFGIGGTRFDARGMIRHQLQDHSVARAINSSPPPTVFVRRKCARLHFLEGTQGRAPRQTTVGRYLLHFVGGETHPFEIKYGEHVWCASDVISSHKPGEGLMATPAAFATTSPTDPRSFEQKVVLFKTSRLNPHPELEIERIEFVGDSDLSSPFLLAITLEPQSEEL